MSGRVSEYVRTQEYKRLAAKVEVLKSQLSDVVEDIAEAEKAASEAEEAASEAAEAAAAYNLIAEALQLQSVLTAFECVVEAEEVSSKVQFKDAEGVDPTKVIITLSGAELKGEEIVFSLSSPVELVDGEKSVAKLSEIHVPFKFEVPADPESHGDLVECNITEGNATIEPLWIKSPESEKPSIGSPDDGELILAIGDVAENESVTLSASGEVKFTAVLSKSINA